MSKLRKILALGLLVGIPLVLKKKKKEKKQSESDRQKFRRKESEGEYREKERKDSRAQLKSEKQEFRRKENENERKRKEEERKLVPGKFIILLMARIESYDKGRKSGGGRQVRRELIVDATQRIAFEQRGDGLQSWFSREYPGCIAKNITVVNKGPCTVKDYRRLNPTF